MKTVTTNGKSAMAVVVQELESETRLATIRDMLPPQYQNQANRFVKLALTTYWRGSNELRACTPGSFIATVLEAAGYGLPIDGRLAHAVPYRTKDGKYEATLIVDYKGLIAVARRLDLCDDCWARDVRANDKFDWSEKNGVVEYDYHRNPQDRGDELCYFAVAVTDGRVRLELMDMEELNKIQLASKAQSEYAPWGRFPVEMRKKTVLRRLLKTMTDDAGLIGAMYAGDEIYEPQPKAQVVDLFPDRASEEVADVPELKSDEPSANESKWQNVESALRACRSTRGLASRAAKLASNHPELADDIAMLTEELEKNTNQPASE